MSKLTKTRVKRSSLAKLQAMFRDPRVGREGKPFPPGETVLPDGTRILVGTYSDSPHEWVVPSLEDILGPARVV